MTVEHESEQAVRTQTPPESTEPQGASGETLGAIESVLEMIDQLEAKSETELVRFAAGESARRWSRSPRGSARRAATLRAPRVVPAAAAATDPRRRAGRQAATRTRTCCSAISSRSPTCCRRSSSGPGRPRSGHGRGRNGACSDAFARGAASGPADRHVAGSEIIRRI